MQVVPGELTIVTGVPNSGKSEWIDALLVNLAYHHGWAFAVCSMEKKVRDHARQLLEKTMRKPFFDAPYANNTPRMSWEEVRLTFSGESFSMVSRVSYRRNRACSGFPIAFSSSGMRTMSCRLSSGCWTVQPRRSSGM